MTRWSAFNRGDLARARNFESLAAEFDDATGFFRLDRGGLSILVNLGGSALPLPPGEVLFASGDGLAPHSAVILRRDRE